MYRPRHDTDRMDAYQSLKVLKHRAQRDDPHFANILQIGMGALLAIGAFKLISEGLSHLHGQGR